MQANGGGSIVTNGALTVNGTAVVRGYGASLRISGNQLVLDVVRVSAPTITTIGPFAPSQTYGSVVLSATVSPPDATGAVVFFSDGTIVGTNLLDGVTGTAAGPIFPSLLSVGSHQITATYEGDFYYAGSSSAASSNLTVTSRTVTLTGSKTYDKTAVITPATGLGLANNVDGPNLYLTPSNGIAYLAGWNAGLETITSVLVTNGPFNTADFPSIPGNASQIITNASVHYNLPSRVQSKTGTGGPWVGAGSLTLSLGQTPGNGSTLVALIVTDRNGTDLVSGISQTGATWSRVAQDHNNGSVFGASTALWYAPNVQNAGTNVQISCSSSLAGAAAAVVVEYNNLAAMPLDQMANNNGNGSTGDTGTTPTTTQGYEVWVGGVGVSANNSLCTPNNGFNNVANVTMSWNYILGTYYDTIYGVDTVVTNTGTAGCQPTFGSGHWSGVIATLEASSYYTYTYTYYTTNNSLALAGPGQAATRWFMAAR